MLSHPETGTCKGSDINRYSTGGEMQHVSTGALPAGLVQPCPKPRALIHKPNLSCLQTWVPNLLMIPTHIWLWGLWAQNHQIRWRNLNDYAF